MNYVTVFLGSVLAGEEVKVAEPGSRPYGCPISYVEKKAKKEDIKLP